MGIAFTAAPAGWLFGYVQEYGLEQCLQLDTIASSRCITPTELALPHIRRAMVRANLEKHYSAPRRKPE